MPYKIARERGSGKRHRTPIRLSGFPARLTRDILDGVAEDLRPHIRRIADLAFESVSGRKSRELGRILGQVLAEAQDEGIALVIYERQQTVYHLTVGREM